MGAMVSEIFDPERWRAVEGFSFTDITYHRAVDSGTVRVAFDRPEVRNAFRPHTVDELYIALDHARMSGDVGCVLLTGNGPSPRDGGWAFCSGGDQRIRGRDGYRYAAGDTAETADPALDLVGAWHLLEAGPRQVLRDALGSGDLEWQRGRAWAFEQAMGVVWYYEDTNPAMSRMGRRTLARLIRHNREHDF